jgi:hypothetical protein
MKAIELDIIITRISAKVDGSLSFTATTPELSAEEKVAFIQLQNHNLKSVLVPMDQKEAPFMKVEKDVYQKTQAQRLRNVMFRCWELEKTGDFEEYYKVQMERLIDLYKGKLV